MVLVTAKGKLDKYMKRMWYVCWHDLWVGWSSGSWRWMWSSSVLPLEIAIAPFLISHGTRGQQGMTKWIACKLQVGWQPKAKPVLTHGVNSPYFCMYCSFPTAWRCATRETISPCAPYATKHAATGNWVPLVQQLVQATCLITQQLSSSLSSWLCGVRKSIFLCGGFGLA